MESIKRLQSKRNEESGFTLVELLIVIIILGILAAIVVFAVGGITDRGQTSACSTDKKAIQVAEESYFAQNASTYATMTQLTPKYLHEASTLYTVTPDNTAKTYSVDAISGKGC